MYSNLLFHTNQPPLISRCCHKYLNYCFSSHHCALKCKCFLLVFYSNEAHDQEMDFYQTRKPQLLKLSNILLRVPSIFILELLYNSRTRQILKEGDVLGHSPSQVISEWGFNPDNVTVGVQYVGKMFKEQRLS